MYFNDNNNKEETNIDAEFEKKKFSIDSINKPLIIVGIVVVLAIIIIIIIGSMNDGEITLELVGNDKIEIYRGTEYIDPGYKAYNAKGKDISDKVKVDNKVDTNLVGTYKITYSVKKTSVTRTVKVTKEPEGITYIYLKNNATMHIKKGTKYEEPGYIAIDDYDGDITKNVTTSGTVDTTKVGVYKITYTVTNSKWRETSVTRVVIVE